MTVVLSISPCIDKTIFVKELSLRSINRAEKTRTDLGGKGINVATVLKNLEANVFCVGVNYIKSVISIEERLSALEIEHNLISVHDYIRTNTKIFETEKSEMTEINENSATLSKTQIEEIKNKLRAHCKENDILVLTGSAPQNVDSHFYKEIALLFKNKNVKVIIDADGELLKNALLASPFLIKPNLYELQNLIKKDITSKKDIKNEALNLIEKHGVKYICVSLGSEGAILVARERSVFAKANHVDVKSLQGAGDSMVGGICYALEKNTDMLTSGMAASLASVIREGTELCQKKDFKYFLNKIETEII